MKKTNGSQATAPMAKAATPRGMVRTSSVANAPWWHLKAGNSLYGRLINMYERPDERSKLGKSKFFQVELFPYKDDAGEVHDHYVDGEGVVLATEVRVGRGKQSSFSEVGPGTIINVNYGPKTKDWEPLVSEIHRGAEYLVLAVITGDKFEIKHGQTMWPIDIYHSMTRASRQVDEPDFEDSEPAAAAAE